MADPFNFYLIDVVSSYRGFFTENGFGSHHPGRVCNLIKTYMQAVIDKAPKKFSAVEASICPDSWWPTLLATDVVVYLVPDPKRSVIKANGGSVQMADDDHVLGLTDLNLQICEVYFDRAFDGSPKEIAGAAYHEAAHLKSNLDNSMHSRQAGFFGASPDYNGSPTPNNTSFFAQNISRQLRQVRRTIPS
jgi:hypothetical protein